MFKIWKKMIVLASILILIIGGLFPVCIGNNTEIINQNINKTISDEEETILVTCNIFTFNGIETICKDISLNNWREFVNHVSENNDRNGDKILDIQGEISLLSEKLFDIGIIANDIEKDRIFELIQEKLLSYQYFFSFLKKSCINNQNPVIPNMNFFNIISGEGGYLECVDLKSTIIGGMIWQLVALRSIFPVIFNAIINIIMKRPRTIIGQGMIFLNEGGEVTTIGLDGQKNVNCEDCSITVFLYGFIGIIVNSAEKGYIYGFSLFSGLKDM